MIATDPAELAALTEGELTVRGRIMPASNATFYAELDPNGTAVACVYKPQRGERSLWDFPDGTLASREYAAWLVSDALGWDVVPPTVLREGPVGAGMVQLWREPDPGQTPVDVVPVNAVPAGHRHVFDGLDSEDRPVSLVHEDTVALRRMAVFDVVVNNADRKGGHVLPQPGGHRYGVDHGVTFHTDPKLRTVLWGWMDEPLTGEETAALESLDRVLDGELAEALSPLLSAVEIAVLRERVVALGAAGRMPAPSGDWPSIPWPPF